MDKIRKVVLTMNENAKYNIIKKLVESNGKKQRAAVQINCTVRHINRMIKGYKKHGKAFFIHGNRGRKPVHALDDSTKHTIVDLYRTKYKDTNLTHFSELLEEFEGIKVSSNTIRSILLQEFILSPKAKRTSKEALHTKLKICKNLQSQKSKLELFKVLFLLSKMPILGVRDVPTLEKCFRWMLLFTLGLVEKKVSSI